jgi:hypothetical protein
MNYNKKQLKGEFFTEDKNIINKLLNTLKISGNIFNYKVLEPSVGSGNLVIALLNEMTKFSSKKKDFDKFLKNNLFMNELDEAFLKQTHTNIKYFYEKKFNKKLNIKLNLLNIDFTKKINKSDLFTNDNELKDHLNSFDIVFGNPPFVTLYGRRDKKENESQRATYLKDFDQFPISLKNGKINLTMLFIENSLDLLKKDGKLSYICDGTFFENAFIHTRKYILEKTFIEELRCNLSNFENVYSTQIILSLIKNNLNKKTLFVDEKSLNENYVDQKTWNNPDDNFRFKRLFEKNEATIINKIKKGCSLTLKDKYPKKNLRTSSMLLTYENEFITKDLTKINSKYYRFYHGSQSLQKKYDELKFNKLFNYDKEKQDTINEKLKIKLIQQGIKNKKRIGLGELIVHQMPKVYIRQSSKNIITSFDENFSTANNSLYLFTLRSNKKNDVDFLKFLCGYLNSDIINYYCKKVNIIRSNVSKQPQMNISDLYKIPLIENDQIKKKITFLVDEIYKNKDLVKKNSEKINQILFGFFDINDSERIKIRDYQ